MRPPIPDELLINVLQQYPLANLSVVGPIEASKLNDSFLVEDATGNRYLLRRYRRNPERARVLFQLHFQQELRQRGFPTAEVIESASGNLLVSNEAGLWVLFTYVEGSEHDFARTGQVAEAGRRLGEFHAVTDSIELEEVDIEINPHFRRWWTHGDEELAALSEMFRSDGVEAELAFLQGWRTELHREWPLARLDALPTGWVHSDYHGRNMVFVGDELRGLFDFDPLHRGYWIEDVAHALFMFSREFRGSTHMRPEAARLFVDEYHHVRPLEREERAALLMMAVLAWVPSAPYHELLRRDGEDTLAFFRHYVSLMRDLQTEMERLTPLLREA
jgi:Ser/Thr protein kinase RdoA (MazF antagonist)